MRCVLINFLGRREMQAFIGAAWSGAVHCSRAPIWWGMRTQRVTELAMGKNSTDKHYVTGLVGEPS